MILSPPLPDTLRWHRLDIALRCTQARGSQQSLLSIFEALMKQTTNQVAQMRHRSADAVAHELKAIFRLPRRYALKQLPILGQRYHLQVRLFGPLALAQCWCEALCQLFGTGQIHNYELLGHSELLTCRPADLILPEWLHNEVTLEFFTPFFLRHGQREQLDMATLEQVLKNRLQTVFNREFDWGEAGRGITLVPWYWRYEQHERQPKSQPGRQYLNGCVGRLYLKGDLTALLPYLVLAEETQLGSKLNFGLGYFELQTQSTPYFASNLLNPNQLIQVIHDVLERYDDAAEALATVGNNNEADLANTLISRMTDPNDAPELHNAYYLAREDHAPRLLERLHLHELTLHLHLNRLLAPILDKIFTPSSIGYRKGYSRETAAKRIQQAIQDGYQSVVKADIADFFPSIDLDRLWQLLQQNIPATDHHLLRLLHRAIHTGYRLNGAEHQRQHGLAQGSPLSPLLANLYLDSFDRALQCQHTTMRLIRYADDFVCLLKSEAEAEPLLQKTRELLTAIGLTLSEEKSLIRPINEGFRFLGIEFGPDAQEETHAPPLLKKPVYITRPGFFLGVSGEALDIRQQGKLVESFPLHRVSEIIVLGQASFSTNLVRKCAELNIPIALTLQSGYHTAAITPDSGRCYQIAYQQAIKYHALSDSERLSIGQSFAAAKVTTYCYLFRQRYRPGINEVMAVLEDIITSIRAADNIAAVRGYEGLAARHCFAELNHHINNPAFHIEKRERNQPDPINSLLNFGYYLLFTRINLTIRALGLNPYLSFLHDSGQRYETLSYDIEELFRASVDRLIIRVINLKIITEADFHPTEQGMRLTREGSQRFVEQFEREMAIAPRSGDEPLGKLIYAQGIALRNYFTRDQPLLFFTWGSGWRE